MIERLHPALTDPRVGKTAHNAKFDMMVFARQGVWIEGLLGDTMVAAYLLNPGRRGLGLKELAFENLGVIMTPISDLIGTGKKQITMAQVPIRTAADYAGADADMALRLHKARPAAGECGVERLYREIELPLIPVLARMELTGMLIDPPFFQQMATQLDEQLNALSSAIYASVGHEFNLNSPKQLGEVLFNELKLPAGRKTKTGYSVDAAIVDGLRGMHEAVDSLLEHRQISKLKGTYVDALPALVNPRTPRAHVVQPDGGGHRPAQLDRPEPAEHPGPDRAWAAKSARRSCRRTGWMLITADYSQIELRLLAHFSGDEPALRAAFAAGHDIHTPGGRPDLQRAAKRR